MFFACTLLHRELRDYSLGQVAFAGPSARPYLEYMRALGPFNAVWYGWALDPLLLFFKRYWLSHSCFAM